jgi:hypothetical protein
MPGAWAGVAVLGHGRRWIPHPYGQHSMLIRLRGKGIESRSVGPFALRPADGVPTGRSRKGAGALAGDGHDRDKFGRDDDGARYDPH